MWHIKFLANLVEGQARVFMWFSLSFPPLRSRTFVQDHLLLLLLLFRVELAMHGRCLLQIPPRLPYQTVGHVGIGTACPSHSSHSQLLLLLMSYARRQLLLLLEVLLLLLLIEEQRLHRKLSLSSLLLISSGSESLLQLLLRCHEGCGMGKRVRKVASSRSESRCGSCR